MGPPSARCSAGPIMFAVLSSMAPGVVYYNQVRIPPLPSGDWLRLRDGLSLLEEQTDATTRTGDLASVGGTVWPAAASLCAWLREHAVDVAGASVLELGSGTGACGLYAAALGATRVVLTDGREGLRPLQEDNIRRNAPLMRAGTLVTSETLAWGKAPPPAGARCGWHTCWAVAPTQRLCCQPQPPHSPLPPPPPPPPPQPQPQPQP